MNEFNLIIDLVLAIIAAFVGGAIVMRMGQPPVLGYLLAGLAIGPHAIGLVSDVDRVRVLAEIGVAFLMFALGVEFSLVELRRVRNVAVFGGATQILLVMAMGLPVGRMLGLDWRGGIYLGSLMALSSTMVAIKLLMDRGEMDSLHGRIALGFLIVQDLSVVPLMVILPTLARPEGNLLVPLAIAVGKAVVVLLVTYYLGTRVIPWLLLRVAETNSREMFLLAVVTLALGTAIATNYFGLSFAFGAFLAGIIVSESEFNRQVLAEIMPLRDIFATLFFVSVGMLINLSFVLTNALMVLSVVGVIIIGKFVVCAALPLAFGYPGRAAIFAGLTLAQIGEFSFVLAQLGLDRGIISDYLYSLTLTAALGTILLAPTLLTLAPATTKALQSLPGLGRLFAERAVVYGEKEMAQLTQHVVIAGFGRVGRELADALERRGFKYAVIDYNPHVVEEAKRRNIPAVYGDAANEAVLAHVNLPKARVLAITLPEPAVAEVAIRNARRINSRLDIIVRAHSVLELQRMRQTGATEVVHPEFEAGLEFIRHTLHRFGVSRTEIQAFLNGRREGYYG